MTVLKEVKEEGKNELLIDHEQDIDRYPVLEPGQNINIFVDGQKIDSPTVITEENEVNYEISVGKEKKKKINVELSDDYLKAYINIKVSAETKYKLKFEEMGGTTIVSAEPQKEEYPIIEKKELLGALAAKKVFFGIKNEVLDRLRNTRENKKLLVAEGREPEPGEASKIEAVVPERIKGNKEEKGYFHNNIFSVLPGEVVAEKKEGKPGQKGKTVQGQILPPPHQKDVELVAGKNIILGNSGKKAIAQIAGRPEFNWQEDKVVVDLVPQHVIDGDVDRETGMLEFTGDLMVRGSISDFFGADVGGGLIVKENIENAEINCEDHILVGNNIIGSKITAGQGNTGQCSQYAVVEMQEELAEFCRIFQLEIEENIESGTKKEINQKGRELLNEFNKLKDCIKNISSEQKNNNSQNFLSQKHIISEEEIETLKNYLLGYKQFTAGSIAELSRISDKILRKLEFSNLKQNSSIICDYLQNSEIFVPGNIYLMGQGGYTSHIEAGANIICNQPRSFLKSGHYRAGGWLIGGLMGAPMSNTQVFVGSGVMIKKIRGSVTIKAPEDRRVMDQNEKNIFMKVNQDGKLDSLTWPGWHSWVNQLQEEELISRWQEI